MKKIRSLSSLLSLLLCSAVLLSCSKGKPLVEKPHSDGSEPVSATGEALLSDNLSGICVVTEFPMPDDYAASHDGITFRNGTFSADLVFFEDGSSYVTYQRKTMTFDAEGENLQIADADADRIAVMDTYPLNNGLWLFDDTIFVFDLDYRLSMIRTKEEEASLDLPAVFGYDLQEERRTYHYIGKSYAPFDVLDVSSAGEQYYILTTEGVCALDHDGQLLWVQGEMNRPNAILASDKGLWYFINNCGVEQLFGKRELYLLDETDGHVLESLELPDMIRNGQPLGGASRLMGLYPGDETCDFYIATSIGLWALAAETSNDGSMSCTAEERIDWLNSGVSPDNLFGLCIADAKTVAVLDGWAETCHVLLLRKPDTPPKTGTITLASFCENSGLNMNIHKVIERYNRSDSDCTILVTDFTVYDKSLRTTFFNAEMAAGRIPDIVLMQTDSVENSSVFSYIHSEIFCDLIPLLKADAEFLFDDLLGYVTKPYQTNGEQRVFPLHPLSATYFGSSDSFDGPMTAAETMDMIRSLPAGTKWGDYIDYKDSILVGVMNDFYSFEDAKCYFDDGRFADILYGLEKLPEQKFARGGAGQVYNPQMVFRAIAEGKTMLAEYEAWSLADFALMKQCTETGLVAVGYPNEQKKLYVQNGWNVYFAVTEASDQKEESVDFLKTLLDEFQDVQYNNVAFYAEDVYDELLRYEGKTVALDSFGIRVYDDDSLPSTVVKHFKLTRQDADEYIAFLNSIDALIPTDSPIYEIYSEECGSLLQRKPEDTAKIIQSRVSIFLSEKFG